MEIILEPNETITFYHGDSLNAYDFQMTNTSTENIILNYEEFSQNMFCLHSIINKIMIHVFFKRYEVKKL